ncbi:hypothetical protein [Tenacibaculum maritimum]|uniref:hypothetical protein n=1 Tax=Tenacibaculum maritimum TaxID=107401 RepID=UPI0038762189
MKTHYLWILFALLRCGPQKTAEKQITQPPKEEGIFLHQLAKTMTTQALDILKQQGYQYKKQDTFFIKDGTLNIKELQEKGTAIEASDGYQTFTSFYYEKTTNNLSISLSGDSIYGYSKKIAKKDDWIVQHYQYDNKGFIKRIGSYYPNHVDLGVWYDYTPSGLVAFNNLDTPYAFSWRQIVSFIKNKKIKKEHIYEIRRWVDEDTKYPYWLISIIIEKDGLGSPTVITQYLLNGNSGKLIDKKKVEVTRYFPPFDN